MIRTNFPAIAFATVALLCGSIATAQPSVKAADTPNYALAERFSANRVSKMVFTTKTNPKWFRQGDKFLYEWKTSDGTQYYIADPVAGRTTPVFDLDKLAMKITEITRDPFDARHIPFHDLKIDRKNWSIISDTAFPTVTSHGTQKTDPRDSRAGRACHLTEWSECS